MERVRVRVRMRVRVKVRLDVQLSRPHLKLRNNKMHW